MNKKSHVEFFKGKHSREWFWHLRAPNGRVVAQGEGFSSEAKARASFAAVAKYAGVAVERA